MFSFEPGLNITSVFPSGLVPDGKTEGRAARRSRDDRRRRCAGWVASRRIVLTTPPRLRDRPRPASVRPATSAGALVVEAGITLRKFLWDNDLATRYGLRVSHGVSEGRKSRYPLGLRDKHAETERSRGSTAA